jgi:hypothetical protein
MKESFSYNDSAP